MMKVRKILILSNVSLVHQIGVQQSMNQNPNSNFLPLKEIHLVKAKLPNQNCYLEIN